MSETGTGAPQQKRRDRNEGQAPGRAGPPRCHPRGDRLLGCALTAGALIGSALAVAGCTLEFEEPDGRFLDEDVGKRRMALAHPGPWEVPLDVRAIGDEQDVAYTGAGPWRGDASCSGGLTPGAGALRTYLSAKFPQAWHIGGYSCRAIVGVSSQASVHATGRALDVHIEVAESSAADNDEGDPVGNFLIEHAEHIGIQYIIWDRGSWRADRADGDKVRPYTGAHPHNDHLHVELSVAAGDAETSFFRDGMADLPLPICEPLPVAGGLVDDAGPCFAAYGPAAYWRSTTAGGVGGALRFTHAYEADQPSNYARWEIVVSAPGTYRVAVSVPAGLGDFTQTRYVLWHGSRTATRYVDQTTAIDGFIDLGEFEFDGAGDEALEVYDDHPGPVAEGLRIVADAVRLTAVAEIEPALPAPSDDHDGGAPAAIDSVRSAGVTSESGPRGAGALVGGCSLAATAQGAAWVGARPSKSATHPMLERARLTATMALLALAIGRLRRRRRRSA